MAQSKGAEFDFWVRSRSNAGPFYVAGHRFEKSLSRNIIIERGTFELEEALEVGHILLSIIPVAKLSAEVAIWEKNGNLVKVVLVATIVLLVIVIPLLRN
jgi:hypothetical protein